MAEITIVPAEPSDIAELVANLRQADIDEIEASLGGKPAEAVAFSMRRSSEVWAARVDGKLACIFGVGRAGVMSEFGVPWMLGTTLLDRYPGALMKRTRGYIADMLKTYPILANAVDSRNVRSVRWLKRLGFKLYPPRPHPLTAVPFHVFEMRA